MPLTTLLLTRWFVNDVIISYVVAQQPQIVWNASFHNFVCMTCAQQLPREWKMLEISFIFHSLFSHEPNFFLQMQLFSSVSLMFVCNDSRSSCSINWINSHNYNRNLMPSLILMYRVLVRKLPLFSTFMSFGW